MWCGYSKTRESRFACNAGCGVGCTDSAFYPSSIDHGEPTLSMGVAGYVKRFSQSPVPSRTGRDIPIHLRRSHDAAHRVVKRAATLHQRSYSLPHPLPSHPFLPLFVYCLSNFDIFIKNKRPLHHMKPNLTKAKVTEVENRMLLSSMAWFTSLLCLVIVVSNCCIKTCRTCSRIGRRGKGVGLAGPAAVGRTDDRRRKVLNHSVAHAESRVCPPGRAVEDSGMIGRGGAPGGLVDCPCYYRGDGSLYHEEPHGGGAWTGAEDVGRNVGGGYCAGKHAR